MAAPIFADLHVNRTKGERNKADQFMLVAVQATGEFQRILENRNRRPELSIRGECSA